MALVMTPIFTQTVGSGGASTVSFNNIPQFYTDLKLVISARCDTGTTNLTGTLRFNGDSGNNYSATRIDGGGTAVNSARFSPTASIYAFYGNDVSSTSNVFSSSDIYIPNYTASVNKSVLTDSVTENNGTAATAVLTAGLWRNTAAITSISLGIFTGTFAQHSTFSLYGIIRNGA